jgi:hypothetical protein
MGRVTVPARFHNENSSNLLLRSYTVVTVIILSLYICYCDFFVTLYLFVIGSFHFILFSDSLLQFELYILIKIEPLFISL